jgi:hypothetical protein
LLIAYYPETLGELDMDPMGVRARERYIHTTVLQLTKEKNWNGIVDFLARIPDDFALNELYIEGAAGLGAGVKEFTKLPPAKRVILEGVRALEHLPEDMPHLEELILHRASGRGINACVGLQQLPKQAPKLRAIFAWGCRELREMPYYPSLEVLDTGGCTKLTQWPTNSPMLRRLGVDNCPIEFVPDSVNLKEIVPWPSQISEATLTQLRNKYPGLVVLGVDEEENDDDPEVDLGEGFFKEEHGFSSLREYIASKIAAGLKIRTGFDWVDDPKVNYLLEGFLREEIDFSWYRIVDDALRQAGMTQAEFEEYCRRLGPPKEE